MHKSLIKLAVISAMSMMTTQLYAAPPNGFKNLPTTGFAVTGGTSAYTTCNVSGTFGAGISVNPTATDTATCAVLPVPVNDAQLPSSVIGYPAAPVASAVRTLTVNNVYTGGSKNIGTVYDVVWRNTANTECIYGTKVTMIATDYNTAGGAQYFEVNDIARGGFGTRPVAVAYTPSSSTGEVVFRAGRTFTSVQNRGAGYAALPLTSPAFTGSINGLDETTTTNTPVPSEFTNLGLGIASAAQQTASINTNWVDLTTNLIFRDDDGSTKSSSHMTYIHSTCTAAAPVAVPNAIRIRQTFQNRSNDYINLPANKRLIEINTTGFVPPGGTAIPAPVVPF